MMRYGLLIRDLYVLLVLLIASYWDYRKREIEPSYWVYTSITGIILSVLMYRLGFIGVNLETYLVFSLFAIGLVGLFYLLGYMGGADLYAIIFITVSTPRSLNSFELIPSTFMTVVYAAVASALIPVYFCLYNVVSANRRKIIHKQEKGFILCFLGIPKRAKEYIRDNGYWFPLTTYTNGKLVTRYSFHVEEEPDDHRQSINSLLNENVIDENSIIWVTPGIPFIIFILIGYLLSIIISDIPLQILFGGLGG
ncbi:MAG: prepilin peptidase [Desulfurococcales archaeon]|nr:prepilin peptidase [Desulfurococcales archaeon]